MKLLVVGSVASAALVIAFFVEGSSAPEKRPVHKHESPGVEIRQPLRAAEVSDSELYAMLVAKRQAQEPAPLEHAVSSDSDVQDFSEKYKDADRGQLFVALEEVKAVHAQLVQERARAALDIGEYEIMDISKVNVGEPARIGLAGHNSDGFVGSIRIQPGGQTAHRAALTREAHPDVFSLQDEAKWLQNKLHGIDHDEH
jgi:hypothetical protein